MEDWNGWNWFLDESKLRIENLASSLMSFKHLLMERKNHYRMYLDSATVQDEGNAIRCWKQMLWHDRGHIHKYVAPHALAHFGWARYCACHAGWETASMPSMTHRNLGMTTGNTAMLLIEILPCGSVVHLGQMWSSPAAVCVHNTW